jgi:hypothetical protein
MSDIKYDKNGKWIPFHVSKENPCPICDAVVDNAHANYCPNIVMGRGN